jgi:triacylglycerol esterase/lipase EstA (alpha/beta hydrolase family)
MSKVIIAIHGLGNKPPKKQLLEWGKMAIQEGLHNNGYNIELPEFELVYWADLLYDRPQTMDEPDPQSPYYLDEIYTKTPANYRFESSEFRKYFADFFKKVAYRIFLKRDYHLRYAFVSQKLLHKYFYELEVYFNGDGESGSAFNFQTKEKIIERFNRVLEKHTEDEIILIAHSMGTIIAFDVLSFINQNVSVDTLVTMGAPLGAPFVISRIAAHSKSTYGKIQIQTPESVYNNWFNFSDIRDKIALDYKLSEDFDSNSQGVKCVDKLVTNTYVMNGMANPHKSFGYLRTPEFVDVLVNFLQRNSISYS